MPVNALSDDQRTLERWRTHVRMAEQALTTQGQQLIQARVRQADRVQRLEASVPNWRRWVWARPWGRWDRERWVQRHGVASQGRFLQDWQRTQDAMPAWIEAGQVLVNRTDPCLAESFWARWCDQGLFLLDGLLDVHPQRRGNVMPFRGLRHTLASAVQPGRPLFVQALIDGASFGRTMAMVPAEEVNRVDAQGYTFLHHALLAERWDVAQALIGLGADPRCPVAHRATVETPLFLAALTGQVAALNGLLDLGVSPNGEHLPVTSPWYGPLHVAAQSGHDGAVRVLVERGAATDRRDLADQTPDALADAHGHPALARWIRRHSPARPEGPST